MWRYRELLPVRRMDSIVSMQEGYTPLYPLPRLGAALGLGHLLIKDEGANPGGTFKARGAAAGVSRAVELGATKVALGTNGNAGEAWALYGARAGIETVVSMPVDAQEMTLKICASCGAEVHLVRGLISDAGDFIRRGTQEHGWFDVSTLKEPYRLEGKKTMAYEIAEQLDWSLPDVIVFPTGGGIAIAAMYKAFCELRELGWISGSFPRLIAVQAEGCAPFAKAFREGRRDTDFCQDASTFANGLRVPRSFGDFMVLDAIYATKGCVVTVSDDEIRAGIIQAAKLEGVFLCPEAGAVVPGVRKLVDREGIGSDELVVMMGTGNGLKYPDAVRLPELPVVGG
jgi:threonine synthase